jgi:DNA-binding CsgD family transcriptional regulator
MDNYFKNGRSAFEYATTHVATMKQLAEPLFLNTQITDFSYLRFSPDGSVTNLTTDINWIQFRFTENIKYKILFESDLTTSTLDKPHLYLWPNEIQSPLLGALHHYGIWNGCNIYIPSENQIEVFSFASSRDNTNAQSFCVNHLNLLMKYILYFKSHQTDLIQKNLKGNSLHTDIVFPKIIQSNPHPMDWLQNELTTLFLDEQVRLTHRELACCYYLIQGFSLKAIANKLQISPRTVETHLNHTKIKTNCQTKNLLIQYLHPKRWMLDSLFMDKDR